jgi:hypothetical protein
MELYGVDTHARSRHQRHRLEHNVMTTSSSGVRPASAQVAAACLAIYRPYVQNTAISWEIDVPTVGEMAVWAATEEPGCLPMVG